MDPTSNSSQLFMGAHTLAIQLPPGIPQRVPERSPKVARELPSQKTCICVLDLLFKQCSFEQGRKY